jgi:type I restriction enzyme R subunit
MDERAFSILRIVEALVPDVDHASLQTAAIQIGDLYAAALRDQPSWFFMDGYRKDLRKSVRPILRANGVADAAAVCDKIEEFAVHAYAGTP